MRAAQKALKMSCIHPFGHHNWTRIIFGKPWFWPAVEPFVVPKWPIFKALSVLRGAKIAHSTCLFTPNSPKVSLEKHLFDPFLTNLWSQNSPFSRHFVTLEGPKWLAMGSKRAHFTCLCTPNGLGSFLEKHIFDPFFDPFFVPKEPIFKAFWESRRAKTGHHELKTRQKHLFWHSMWSWIIFDKSHFFAPSGLC